MNSEYIVLKNYLQRSKLEDMIIDEILNCFSVSICKKDSYFAKINEKSDKVGFIVSGLFFMSIIKDDGSIFVKKFILNNEFLIATFDPEVESVVDIQTIKESIILEGKWSDIQKIFKKYEKAESLMKKRMEKEVDLIYEKMTQYATLSSTERYLLFKQEFNDYEKEIPQYLIASHLGITPTQLSRIRGKLKFNKS